MAHVASRRGFLVALAAFTGSTTAGIVAVPAQGIAMTATPDAALAEAETRWRQAVAFRAEAEARANRAYQAEKAALGACSPALAAEWGDHPLSPLQRHVHYEMKTPLERDTVEADGDGWRYVWTAAALRCAIANAVPVLGRGGQTPHVIRHLRSLVPIAEVRDAHRAAVERRYGYRALHDAARAAREAEAEAGALIVELPAATMTGVQVKLRYADDYLANQMAREWQTMMPAPFKAVHEAVRQLAQVQA